LILLIKFFKSQNRKLIQNLVYIDSNDSDIQIESLTSKTKHVNGNGYRKSNTIPTLMITVTNNIAQANHEQIVSPNGKENFDWNFEFRFVLLDAAEPATLQHIFSDASYFLIKSINEENISIAKAKVNEIWFNKIIDCFFSFFSDRMFGQHPQLMNRN